MQMLIFFLIFIECYYACKTCVNGLDNGCETCDPSRTLVDSRCICPITKIDDGENNKCLGKSYII